VPIPVMPMFNWTLSYNPGAAWSFLSDAGGWQRWFFVIIAAIVSIVITMWLKKLPSDQKWLAAALALVLGGAVGNVIDRVLTGEVIDFIHVYYQQWNFPVFNIADCAISIGIAILLFDGFFGNSEKNEKKD